VEQGIGGVEDIWLEGLHVEVGWAWALHWSWVG